MGKPSFWIFAVVFYAAAFWFLGVIGLDGTVRVIMAGSIAAIALSGWVGMSDKRSRGD